MSLWIERERYSGKTAELIDALVMRCYADEAESTPFPPTGQIGTDWWNVNRPGTVMLMRAMAYLSFEPTEQERKAG